MDDKPVMRKRWPFWAALAAGGILWVLIWYVIGAVLWFILSLK